MEKLKKIVGIIEDKGTCFLINEMFVISARHIIENKKQGDNVEINFKGLEKKVFGEIVEILNRPYDFALVKLKDKIKNVDFLPLSTGFILMDENFEFFGYPEEAQGIGKIIKEGKINDNVLIIEDQENEEDEIDLKIYSPELIGVAKGYIKGFSGSPLIVGGEIVGIIKSSLGDNCIGVQKLNNFKENFNKYEIKYKETSYFSDFINKKAIDEVQKNIDNKKYMPDIYIEIPEIKEKIRYFSDPSLFKKQLISRLNDIDTSYINNILEKLTCSSEFNNFSFQNEELDTIEDAIIHNRSFIEKLNKMENIESLKLNKEALSELSLPIANATYPYDRFLEKMIGNIQIMNKKVMFILDTAGQGKTSLICDAIHRLYIPKKQLAIFIPAYAIANGNIIEFFNEEYLLPLELEIISFLKKIDEHSKYYNKKATIFIDGLNENENYKQLSLKLETFIKCVENFKNIKIVISCRTEYFEEKFPKLLKLEKNDNVFFLKEIFRVKSKELQKKALEKYFNYFKINTTYISENVKEHLCKNPLLLRFFSEAYKNKTLPNIISIYKFDLFKEYTKNKCEELKQNGDNEKDLFSALDTIVKYMLENKIYSRVPLDQFASKDFIKKVIYQDVIFREDLEESHTRLGIIKKDVISFTFDEYRDYNIAAYICDNLSSQDILDKLNILINTPCFEGVSRYVYHIAKEDLNKKDLLKLIEKESWSDICFIEYIFLRGDVEASTEELKKLEELFNLNANYTFNIFFELSNRKNSKNLNLQTLISFLKNMPVEKYVYNLLAIFQENKYGWNLNKNNRQRIKISEITDKLKEIYQNDYERAYILALLILPTPYDYDIYWKLQQFIVDIHNHDREKSLKILNYLLENSKNSLLNSFLLELKGKNTCNFRMSYLYSLEEIVRDTK